MPVAELQRRITGIEFMEWMAYAEVEPFGDARADLHFSLLSYLVASIFGTKKGIEPPQPADFHLARLLELEQEPGVAATKTDGKARTPGEQSLLLRTITQTTGGKFLKPDGNTDHNDSSGPNR